MEKIPTIYTRDWDRDPKYVTQEPNPACDIVWHHDDGRMAKIKARDFRA